MGNGQARGGYAIYCFDADADIHNNVMRSNIGTAVYCDYYGSSRIVGNVITGTNGTAIANNGHSTVMKNNFISGNKKGIAQTIIASTNNSLYMANNTIVANGTGITTRGVKNLQFYNNIVSSNGFGIQGSSSLIPYLQHNCIFNNTGGNYIDCSPGEGDISRDPSFVDAVHGNYHLAPGSPCIDAGYTEGATDSDLDGFSRPRDGDGNGSSIADMGCYEAPANYATVASAKALPDGSPVGVACAVSTGLFADRFYAETSDRVSGIGVLGKVSSPGKGVIIEGKMATFNGERVIEPTAVSESGLAETLLPWYLSYSSIGGGKCGLQEAVQDYRKVKDPESGEFVRKLISYGGANNIGLLIKTTGKVTHCSDGCFYLDGTANFDDGDESVKGIQVSWPYTEVMPVEGSFVEITAISSCTMKDGILVRMLRPVSADSVIILR